MSLSFQLFSFADLTGRDIFFFQNSSGSLQNPCHVVLRAGMQAFYQGITESAELLTASTSMAFLLTKAASLSGRKTLPLGTTITGGPCHLYPIPGRPDNPSSKFVPLEPTYGWKERINSTELSSDPPVLTRACHPHTYSMYIHTHIHINNKQIL